MLFDAPLVALRIGSRLNAPGAWQLTSKAPDVDYRKIGPALLALSPMLSRSLGDAVGRAPISASTLSALKAAASSEADRWLIDAAALDGLSKRAVDKVTAGNSTRAMRKTSQTIQKANTVVSVHETYRRLARRNALREASILLGDDPCERQLP